MKTILQNSKPFRILGMLLFLVLGCSEEDVTPPNPTASFLYTVDAGNALKIGFISELTNATSISWDFGDGTIITKEINPTHTYPKGGTYSVTLTVEGVAGTTPAVYSEDIIIEKVFVEVNIENGEFTLPGTSKQTNWGSVPGWSSDTPATDSGVEGGGDNWTAFLKTSDPSVFNLTSHAIAEGEEFKVTMDVWDIWNAAKFTIKFYYDTGNGIRNEIEAKTFDVVASQNNAFSYTVLVPAAASGAKLGIEFDNASVDGTDGWTGFDNVKLFTR